MNSLRSLLLYFTMASMVSATVVSDIPYRSEAGAPARCVLDLHTPANTGRAPLLVWFHGGSLLEGHKADAFNLKVAQGFTAQGLAVAMVNYRQSPKNTFPSYVKDAAAAIAWCVRNASARGLDSTRIYVGGHSAGAYLSLLSILDPSYLKAAGVEATALKGVISISAQTLTHSTVLEERGATSHPIQLDQGAPLFFAIGTCPRLLLLCAEHDVSARIEENQLLGAILRRTPNNSVSFKIIPDRDHMSIIERASSPTDLTARAIFEFISE